MMKKLCGKYGLFFIIYSYSPQQILIQSIKIFQLFRESNEKIHQKQKTRSFILKKIQKYIKCCFIIKNEKNVWIKVFKK